MATKVYVQECMNVWLVFDPRTHDTYRLNNFGNFANLLGGYKTLSVHEVAVVPWEVLWRDGVSTSELSVLERVMAFDWPESPCLPWKFPKAFFDYVFFEYELKQNQQPKNGPLVSNTLRTADDLTNLSVVQAKQYSMLWKNIFICAGQGYRPVDVFPWECDNTARPEQLAMECFRTQILSMKYGIEDEFTLEQVLDPLPAASVL